MFELKVEGFFEIYSDKRGLLAKSKNLVLNQGLEYMATNWLPGYVWLGSGSTPPTVNDTQLASFKAKSSNVSPRISQQATITSTPPYYAQQRLGVRFAAGEAAGNITEIGIGSYNTLITRALIKDAEGIPTTLVVLPDEIIDVAYYYRVYHPTNDVSGQITLTGNIGGTYNWLARPSKITTLGSGLSAYCDPSRPFRYYSYCYFHTGSIGSIFEEPSGSFTYTNVQSPVYVANSLQITHSYTMATTDNLTGNLVKSIKAPIGPIQFQVEFTPAIPKTNLDTLTLNFTYTFGRYE